MKQLPPVDLDNLFQKNGIKPPKKWMQYIATWDGVEWSLEEVKKTK